MVKILATFWGNKSPSATAQPCGAAAKTKEKFKGLDQH